MKAKTKSKPMIAWRLFQIMVIGTTLIIVGIVLILLLVIANEIALSLWMRGGYIRTTLPSEYLPRAEYLMEHPQPTPEYLIIEPPSGLIQSPLNMICLGFDNEDGFINDWSHFAINKQRLPSEGKHINTFSLITFSDIEVCFEFSQENQLQPGLHLIEFQLRSTPFDTRFPMYEWAIEVKN